MFVDVRIVDSIMSLFYNVQLAVSYRVLPGKSIQNEPKPVSFEHARAVYVQFSGLPTHPGVVYPLCCDVLA